MSKEHIYVAKLQEQIRFLHEFNFGYTDEYVQMLIQQIQLRDTHIHTLENALLSYRDFMKNPTIAGDDCDAISIYAEALHARTRKLLDGEEEK